MAISNPPWQLGELAAALGGECSKSPETLIETLVEAGAFAENAIALAESDKYLRQAESGKLAAVIIKPGMTTDLPAIIHDQPRVAFLMLLHALDPGSASLCGIHPTAITENALIPSSTAVGAYAYISPTAKVGAEVKIHPFVYVGPNCKVGDGTELFPHVVLQHSVTVGARCRIHSGTVIGSDGFGYSVDAGQVVKIPQIGRVVIGDDVEIGANTTIDRATCGETKIGNGAKLDNMVHIAHNVEIGPNALIAAQVGIAGSSRVGRYTMIGGQAGVGDHVTVGDMIRIGGGTHVFRNLSEPGEYFGPSAEPVRSALRSISALRTLPELAAKVAELERKIEELS